MQNKDKVSTNILKNKIKSNNVVKTNIQEVNEKNLPNVFKELQEARMKQTVQIKNDLYKKSRKKVKNAQKIKEIQNEDDYNYDIYQKYNQNEETIEINHKFNAIGAIIGILIVILFMTTIKSNYIFATSKEEEKRIVGTFEKNENPLDLMQCISNNISETTKKEIVTEGFVIEKEIEYIENSQLPKDEQVVIEQGKDGYKEITYIRSFASGELIDEIIINDVTKEETIKSVIQVGTSEFLANNRVHIGDTMYTKKETMLMSEPNTSSEAIGMIYEYIDLKVQAVEEDWCRVSVDGIDGYVKTNEIISSALNPQMPEKSRVKRILVTVKSDMEINKPSGLTKEDFKKVLSGNTSDIYKIFENSAETFYNIEQKYNINGLFLASIGIHESNWGTSKISQDKKNLFGYGAYDSSPYDSSVSFETYETGIETLAKVLSKHYLNIAGTVIYDGEIATGMYYNGPTISGVNVRYASDTNWSNRVYEIMTGLYDKLDN